MYAFNQVSFIDMNCYFTAACMVIKLSQLGRMCHNLPDSKKLSQMSDGKKLSQLHNRKKLPPTACKEEIVTSA
jgi:hypothetical protein